MTYFCFCCELDVPKREGWIHEQASSTGCGNWNIVEDENVPDYWGNSAQRTWQQLDCLVVRM
jgi:hypothetical protein